MKSYIANELRKIKSALSQRILIVEDDSDICELLASFLDDYSVTCIHDGIEALDALNKHNFHLLIVDGHFPNCRRFFNEAVVNVPVILFSGSGQPKANFEFAALIDKGNNFDLLLDKIKELI